MNKMVQKKQQDEAVKTVIISISVSLFVTLYTPPSSPFEPFRQIIDVDYVSGLQFCSDEFNFYMFHHIL